LISDGSEEIESILKQATLSSDEDMRLFQELLTKQMREIPGFKCHVGSHFCVFFSLSLFFFRFSFFRSSFHSSSFFVCHHNL